MDLVIIIPTLNRSSYLERQLSFISQTYKNNSFDVAVLDGSSEELYRAKNRNLCEKHKAVYFWHDIKTITGYERMLAGVQSSRKKYAIFVPDDDYYFFATIEQCVAYLDANADCAGAYGMDMAFRVDRGAKTVHLTYSGDRSARSYDFEHPLTRVFYLFSEAERATYFSVVRRHTMLESLQAAIGSAVFSPDERKASGESLDFFDPECFYFGDLTNGMFAAIQGKLVNIGALMCAYEAGQSISSNSRRHFGDMIFDEKFQFVARFQRWVDVISKYTIDRHGHLDRENTETFYKNLFMSFVGRLTLFNGLFPVYNKLVDPKFAVNIFFGDTVESSTVALDDLLNGRKTRFGQIEIGENERVFLSHLAQFETMDIVQIHHVPFYEINGYRALHSRLRPKPYGTQVAYDEGGLRSSGTRTNSFMKAKEYARKTTSYARQIFKTVKNFRIGKF